jgi:hypothetical protein
MYQLGEERVSIYLFLIYVYVPLIIPRLCSLTTAIGTDKSSGSTYRALSVIIFLIGELSLSLSLSSAIATQAHPRTAEH